MSAYRDKSHGVAFVYTNLYELYVKSKKKNPENKGFVPEPLDIMTFKPRKKDESPGVIKKSTVQTKRSKEIQSLNERLEKLNNAHKRIKYMISELNKMVDTKKKKS